MRSLMVFLVASAISISLSAQTLESVTAAPATPPPQTARQALIEMFLGKGDDDFAKHLPDAARKTLIHKGETPQTSSILRISSLGREMLAQGQHIETFDVGRTLLVSKEANDRERVEVIVEHDALSGDEDEIEVSFQVSEGGQRKALPFIPRLTFAMKQEQDIWRLTEVTAAAHIPLTDPDYLHALRKEQDEANEAAVQVRVGIIANAEKIYVTRHPELGYACALPVLFGPQSGNIPSEAGFVYDPGQGSEEWNGYRFTLSGCDQAPASRFHLSAMPVDSESESKMFCVDESGTVKSQAGRNSSNCLSQGDVLNSGRQGVYRVN
jgi:hypothetical protein